MKTPWEGPGSERPIARGPSSPDRPFDCRFCGASMRLEGAYAKDGEIYCFECRPPDAVAAAELPDDDGFLSLPRSLFARLMQKLARRILRRPTR